MRKIGQTFFLKRLFSLKKGVVFTRAGSGIASLLIFASLSTGIGSCNDGSLSFEFTSDPIKAGADCAITSSFPETSDLKLSGVAGTTTTFTAGLTDPTCTVQFKLNGTTISTGQNNLKLDASQLKSGVNVLAAVSTTNAQTWTLTQNSLPN